MVLNVHHYKCEMEFTYVLDMMQTTTKLHIKSINGAQIFLDPYRETKSHYLSRNMFHYLSSLSKVDLLKLGSLIPELL